MTTPDSVVEETFRESYSVVLASVARMTRDIDLAEESVQDALVDALAEWPSKGIPKNPAAWISTVARRRAIDRIRRRENLTRKHRVLAGYERVASDTPEPEMPTFERLRDDRLELIFACCHPSLAHDKQVALTLRTVGGLTTFEIANAFLVTEPTMAQRLVRAKSKIRDAGIPFRVPEPSELKDRLASVLAIIYLVFNEGYFSSSGPALIRDDLATKAIELGETLAHLMPDESEVQGLVALMLLQNSRRAARIDEHGEVVLLRDQDRSRWDRGMIDAGLRHLERAAETPTPGPYLLQGRIASEHIAGNPDPDWRVIVDLYDQLVVLHPAPVVLLNRAVAVGEADGCSAGLDAIGAIGDSLAEYHAFHTARAHFLEQCQRPTEATEAYEAALRLVDNDPERRYLEKRLRGARSA